VTTVLFLACLATAFYLGIVLGRRIEVANQRIAGLIARWWTSEPPGCS